jgi:hypothetical protein
MTKTTRLAISLLALGGMHCGAGGDDSTSSANDNVGAGDTSDAGASGGDMNGSGGNGGSGTADAGNGDESDAGMPAAGITGREPECVAAFTRIASCYLSQEQCVDAAVDNAQTLGAGLSQSNCADLATQEGGLDMFAARWNADTACDSTDITGFYPSLNMNAQIKDLCESEPLTADECKGSCANIVPCASGIADMQTADALSDMANCEANCTMQPVLSPLFRCALNAGTECAPVQACFN